MLVPHRLRERQTYRLVSVRLIDMSYLEEEEEEEEEKQVRLFFPFIDVVVFGWRVGWSDG